MLRTASDPVPRLVDLPLTSSERLHRPCYCFVRWRHFQRSHLDSVSAAGVATAGLTHQSQETLPANVSPLIIGCSSYPPSPPPPHLPAPPRCQALTVSAVWGVGGVGAGAVMQAAVNHSICLKRESRQYEIHMNVSRTPSKFPLKGGRGGGAVGEGWRGKRISQ